MTLFTLLLHMPSYICSHDHVIDNILQACTIYTHLVLFFFCCLVKPDSQRGVSARIRDGASQDCLLLPSPIVMVYHTVQYSSILPFTVPAVPCRPNRSLVCAGRPKPRPWEMVSPVIEGHLISLLYVYLLVGACYGFCYMSKCHRIKPIIKRFNYSHL